MTQAEVLLQQLGFGEYEARAYAALLRQHPVNGSELSRASGIPRANIYAILQKLEERHAVVRLDTPEGARYSPVFPDDLIAQMKSSFNTVLDATQHALSEISTPPEREYVWNMQGDAPMLHAARLLIAGLENRLVAALWQQEATALAEELAAAEHRGVQITTLCLSGCASPCGGCRGHIYRYPVPEGEPLKRWLVLVGDDQEMVASEIAPDEETLTVRTRQRVLVELTSCYIPQTIALTAVLDDLAERQAQVLAPETQAILEQLELSARTSRWPTHIPRPLTDWTADGPPGRPAVGPD